MVMICDQGVIDNNNAALLDRDLRCRIGAE